MNAVILCFILAQPPVAPPVCDCKGTAVCVCGSSCLCGPTLTAAQVYDRANRGETLTLVVGAGTLPSNAFRLSGELKGSRNGKYKDGTYTVKNYSGVGVGIVPFSAPVTTFRSDCPDGRCPLQR